MPNHFRILIVEDEMMTARFLGMLLEGEGHEVLPAVATGEAAIISAEQNQPTLILMDIRLAGSMDGIQAAEKILAKRTAHIIFMTGYREDAVSQSVQKFRPLGCLEKPLTIADIKTLLDEKVPK